MIIKNGLVVLPGEDEPRKLDIRVTGEVITAIGGSLDGGHGPVIDADGLYILPGAVDPHVHFDDPGYTEREDFDHGTAAAAGGGVTTVIDMPCTSVPPVTSAENLARKLAVISREARVDYGLFGGVCGTMVPLDYEERMSELAPDVLGYKCYLVSGMETFPRLDHAQLELVLRSAASLRMPVLVHAEDHDYIRSAEKLAAAQGDTPYDYYRSRPEIAEILGIRIAVGLAEECGTELHIVHVASAGAAGSLASPLVTAETGPHYLEFDLGDFEEIGSPLKVTPPVKSSINKYLLWKLLREDTINFIA